MCCRRGLGCDGNALTHLCAVHSGSTRVFVFNKIKILFPVLCCWSFHKKAIFAMFKRLKNLGILPVKIMIYLFQSLIRPILVYGSDVWGVNSNATKAMDKVFLWYSRTILKVKSNTCNVITLGECGVILPSIICHKQVMCYYKRLYNMSSNALVKKVFDELKKMDDMGFKTWITSVRELASRYDISLNSKLEFDAFKKFAEMLWSRNSLPNGKMM